MNNFKAATQNFDSSYIYAVEEREESEQIIRESDRGLVSVEKNELPKVTRYFLRNNKGVCTYVGCLYFQSFHCFCLFMCRNRKVILLKGNSFKIPKLKHQKTKNF